MGYVRRTRKSITNRELAAVRKSVWSLFVAFALAHAEAAIENWINGNAPFEAKLHPEYSPYGDYDQLMRLDEWYGRSDEGGGA